MAHAEICPVCRGRGTVRDDPPKTNRTGVTDPEHRCHSCNGKGRITVQDPPLFKPPKNY